VRLPGTGGGGKRVLNRAARRLDSDAAAAVCDAATAAAQPDGIRALLAL